MPDAGVLVVDDGSPDGTAALAEKVWLRTSGTWRPALVGQGGGRHRSVYRDEFLRWGLDRGFEAFVEMDSDSARSGVTPGSRGSTL